MANDAGACQTRNVGSYDDEEVEEKEIPPLDEGDIALLKTYGLGPYTISIKKREEDIKNLQVRACVGEGGREEGGRRVLCSRGSGLFVFRLCFWLLTPLSTLLPSPSQLTTGQGEGVNWYQGKRHGLVFALAMGLGLGQADDAGGAAVAGREGGREGRAGGRAWRHAE